MTAAARCSASVALGLFCFAIAPLRAQTCATLQAAAFGEGLVVMQGSRSDQEEEPRLLLPGCGSQAPEWTLRWTRAVDGRWSAAAELPPGQGGALFEHAGRLWSAGFPDRHSARLSAIILAPLDPSVPFRSEAPREPQCRAVAVATLDKWNFALVQELLQEGLLIEQVTSSGSDESLESQKALVVPTGWPEGSRLLGVAGEIESLAVFARGPDGALHATIVEGESTRIGPPLPLQPAAEALPLWLEGRPALVVAEAGRLGLWSLEDAGWRERGSAASTSSARSWAAASFGPRHERVAAVAWTGEALEAWTWAEGSWTAEAVPEGRVGAVLAPDAKAPGRDSPDAVRPSRAVLAFAALAAFLGAALTARLRSR